MDLQATAFRGDDDLEDLHSFFLSERQFAGDTLWTFGASLKSAYVQSFEFMNHAPVVQLWRDQAGATQAVSRISLGTGEWFHQASPAYRNAAVAQALIQQADATFALLTSRPTWETVCYESKLGEIQQLEQFGYERAGIVEVYMARSLETSVEESPLPGGVQLSILDPTNVGLVHERGMAQADSFAVAEPTVAHAAWMTRSLPRLLSYGRPDTHPSIIAIDADGALGRVGSVLGFADLFYDRQNHIGEFEPVGTRKSARRMGLSRAVLSRGLQEMQAAGMTRAIVRTDITNHAAIATYEAVGFETTESLVRLRKERPDH